ncbi:MAG TPA: anhydro-N-acetylmuramic acid kinase, partial [Woeseiaceae bacterium]|nr:anhydro-N-acetylmuramic acid kinase [Woeseiaceae bacterium]
MKDLYVGLMSGTSMDGIDAVLARFSSTRIEILATHSRPYPADLQRALLEAIRKPLSEELDSSGELNSRVGNCFRDAAQKVILDSGVDRNNIRAIGSHGQTLRHQPDAENPFSMQVGDPQIIAGGTNITTVANFRQADIAAGGQGAPLVPPFHEWMFRSPEVDRAVVNIGGIANITILPADDTAISGFDTGPGNGLMDAWVR